MKRALLSFATGSHVELLTIAWPSFQAFAERHGYDLVTANVKGIERPPSWWKLPALHQALEHYGEVLYLDADTVVVDPSEDLDVPASRWQALVEHQTADGAVPNCGVWLVRRPMRAVLEAAWDLTRFVQHPWWEQAAVCQLMGYRGRPLRRPTHRQQLFEQTYFLDPRWNVHRDDRQANEPARIRHATMEADRAAVMREWATAADLEPVEAA